VRTDAATATGTGAGASCGGASAAGAALTGACSSGGTGLPEGTGSDAGAGSATVGCARGDAVAGAEAREGTASGSKRLRRRCVSGRAGGGTLLRTDRSGLTGACTSGTET